MDNTTDSHTGTIVGALKRLADNKPDAEAFVFRDKFDERIVFSRKDVWDRSRKFAAILKRHGIEKGDIICNTLVNSPERVITAYGSIVAGGVTMHGQVLLADGEDLLHNVRTSKCKVIIVDSGKKADALVHLERLAYKDETTGETRYKDLPNLRSVIALPVYSEHKQDPCSRWLHTLDSEQETFVDETVNENDYSIIFNTSGTTGFSKLVPYPHRKVILLAKIFLTAWNMSGDDAFYSNRSLGWIGGFPHFYHSFGRKAIITSQAHGKPADMASHMIKCFEEEKCDHANLAGVEIERVLESLDAPLKHLLKTVIVGGGPIATFVEKANGVMCKSVLVAYGATEFGLASAIHFDKGSTYQAYCTGHVTRPAEAKILDGNLKEVEDDQSGEIYIRSPCGADCYLNNPEKTTESFLEDGWFKSGDFGYTDSKGHLFVLGRKSTAIMKGAFVFYPGWLEKKILTCPGIQTLAVIGVPDPILYEDICLCTIKTPDSDLTEDILRDFCRDLFASSDKDEISPMPKYLLFFDDFPYNANLKIDLAALKAKACDRLNIEQRK